MMLDPRRVAERTITYLRQPSVVGFEQPFLATLETEARNLGRSVEYRPGLLAVPGGPSTVSAHIDRHGLVTQADQTLVYAANEVSHRTLSPRQAATVCNRYDHEEVIAYDPATGRFLGTGLLDHADHCGRETGVGLEVRGLSGLPAGTPVGFGLPTQESPDHLSGQLDNALSAALAMELLAVGFDGTVLFTQGEEAGVSWRGLASWFAEPSTRLLVLDTSPFDEAGPVERGCVVLRRRDAGADFDPSTTDRLAEAARSLGVEAIWKDEVLAEAGRPLGRTELGRLIAETGGRATGSTLQIPTTDYHTNRERTSLIAIEAACRVLATATTQ